MAVCYVLKIIHRKVLCYNQFRADNAERMLFEWKVCAVSMCHFWTCFQMVSEADFIILLLFDQQILLTERIDNSGCLLKG